MEDVANENYLERIGAPKSPYSICSLPKVKKEDRMKELDDLNLSPDRSSSDEG